MAIRPYSPTNGIGQLSYLIGRREEKPAVHQQYIEPSSNIEQSSQPRRSHATHDSP